MRLLRVWLATLFAVAVSMLAVSPASADSAYWQEMANGLEGQYVYQDPGVDVLSDQQIVAFNDLITQAARPIYIVVVDQSKAGKNTTGYPDEMHSAFQRSGAYAIVGAKTFQASAFNVPSKDVANAVPKAATSAVSAAKARGAKGPDVQMVRDWVDAVTEMDWTTGPAVSGDQGSVGLPQERPAEDSSGGVSGWVIFGIIMVVLAIALIGGGVWLMGRTSSTDEDSDYGRYTPGSYIPPTYSTGKRKRRNGGSSDRPRPSGTRTVTNDHYFGGGTDSNGRYYPPGYYPSTDPFWTYLIWTTTVNNQGGYDDGYRDAARDSAREERVSDRSSRDDSSGHSSGGSGGGDWAPAPPVPTYTPPPAPTKSHSSGGSGGGDWSSPAPSAPSFDFGGGGSTHSSGGSGGGDF